MGLQGMVESLGMPGFTGLEIGAGRGNRTLIGLFEPKACIRVVITCP